jgi:hypothetical protein
VFVGVAVKNEVYADMVRESWSSPEDVCLSESMHGVSKARNNKPLNGEWRDGRNTRSERGEVVGTVIRQGGSDAGMEGYVGESRFEHALPARSCNTAGAGRVFINGVPSESNGSSESQVNRRPRSSRVHHRPAQWDGG